MLLALACTVWEYVVAFLRFVWILQSVHYGVFTYLLLVFLLRPVRFFAPQQFSKIERWLCDKLYGIVSSWVGTCGHHSKKISNL